MIPEKTVESRLHQRTIDANTCMEYLKKYFRKLDQRLTLELNKSKEISLLAENAFNQNFGTYADLIWHVIKDVDNYMEGADEEDSNKSSKKKVGFADIVDMKLNVPNNQSEKEVNKSLDD